MSLSELKSQNLIEKIEPNFKQIIEILERSKKDLRTAKSNLTIDVEWAFAISYHAMLRAGRAFMFSFGYRPKGRDQHKTVVSFCSEKLGKEYKSLINKFNRMRIKRHGFIYETGRPVSESEARRSIKNANQLVDKICAFIKRQNPQLPLFGA